jgi:hypothetical protein
MDRVSSGNPGRPELVVNFTHPTERRALGGRVVARLGDGHQAAQLQTGQAATARHRASCFIGRATAFARFAGDVNLEADLQGRQDRRALRGQAFGNLQTVDRMHPVEAFGDRARLVALQRADEMPFQLAAGKSRTLVDAFLHVVLAEGALAGVGGLNDRWPAARSC